ncbi:hypothetical protein ACI780_19210 [Geodermatophilus sp. SYSU D00814]
MTEPPADGEHNDGEHKDREHEDREHEEVDWSAAFDPLRSRIADLLAPIAQAAQTQLSNTLKPAFAEVRERMAANLSKFDFELPPLPKFTLPPDLAERIARVRESQPPNWSGELNFDALPTVIQGDGIPLVWVPRSEIVRELLDAADRPARIATLIARRNEVVDDCRALLATVSAPDYAGKVQLAIQAVEALAAGHAEAAQALATVVVESATRFAIDDKSKKVQNRVRVDLEEVAYVEIRLRAALAPLDSFYNDWHPTKSPDPMPDELSRHVTCHVAEPSHINEGNAVVAVLLAASVLRGLQELEQVRATIGDPTWLRK